MPRKYKRKEGVRARVCSWTTENLQSAFDEMDKKNHGDKRNIPTIWDSIPLRRRYAAKNNNKVDTGYVLKIM